MTGLDGWNNWIGSETETTSLAANDGVMSTTEGSCEYVQLTVTLMMMGAIGTIGSWQDAANPFGGGSSNMTTTAVPGSVVSTTAASSCRSSCSDVELGFNLVLRVRQCQWLGSRSTAKRHSGWIWSC